MTYQIKYTESTNPSKPAIVVSDRILNSETSLNFPGQNYSGYPAVLGENFLHLLENFASSQEPPNPVEGQLWYDNSSVNPVLKIFNGTAFTPASSVIKSATFPPNKVKGDIWVNTATQQLFIFSGATWVLVGPQYSAGAKTGAIVETVYDGIGNSYNITSIYSDNSRILIISKSEFVPSPGIAGFASINIGVNIISNMDAQMWATATKASALEVSSGVVISASKFARTDISNTFDKSIIIRDSTGLGIGSSANFNIGVTDNSSVFYSKDEGKSISFDLTNGGEKNTVLYVTSAKRIGVNTVIPQTELDVDGSITASKKLIITGTTDTTGLTSNDTASIFTNGGLSVVKASRFGGQVYTSDVITVGLGSQSHDTPVILPDTTDAYNIGSDSNKFYSVYANQFYGEFHGELYGSVSGTLVASKLSNKTTFSIAGDITSNSIQFDGAPEDGNSNATFSVIAAPSLITSKPLVSSATQSDLLMIYRNGTGSSAGLKQISKGAFLSSIPMIPVGTILPFAGTVIPTGYLLCDGSEILSSKYPQLFSVIGYTYQASSTLIGANTFALPDLRGRFALGRNDMDNLNQVPSKDNPKILRDAGGGQSDHMSDPVANIVGGIGGSESNVISVKNLPDHVHDLRTASGQYYAVGLQGQVPDPNATPGYGLPATNTGQGIANSGSVISETHAEQLNVMNPFLTINYIIYTGEL